MGWLTPDNIPSTTVCRQLLIPDNTLIVAAVNGALCRLTEADRWEQYGAVTPDEMAAAMIDVVGEYFTSECNGVCEMSGARVYRAENLNVPDNTSISVSFDAERYDTANYHDNVTNNSRLTVPVAGRYAVSGHVEFSDSGKGFRVVYVRRNGDTYIAADRCVAVAADRATQLCVATLCQLSVGDYLELVVAQVSGGALTLRALAEYSPEFAIQKLSD
jgi:hypothetical protein